jgi:hypothetical protein
VGVDTASELATGICPKLASKEFNRSATFKSNSSSFKSGNFSVISSNKLMRSLADKRRKVDKRLEVGAVASRQGELCRTKASRPKTIGCPPPLAGF